MAIERTLVIFKPDTMRKGLYGKVLQKLVAEAGVVQLTSAPINLGHEQAQNFYKEHDGRPYFEPLVDFMLSGPVVVSVLEGEDAIKRVREVMGSTKEPKAGTIRQLYSESVMHNCIHGSDSPDSAKREIAFFFSELKA